MLDGEKISLEQKQKIYEEVFQKSRKVTQKKTEKLFSERRNYRKSS